MICHYYPEPLYLLFAPDLPALLYYSHLPATVVALAVGLFVFLNGRSYLLNRLLLVISISFSLWTLSNLIAWTNIHSDFILFIWSFFGILSSVISIFCVYFIYVFLNEGRDISLRMKSLFLALLAPVIVFGPFAITGFNISDCDAFGFENLAYELYYTTLGGVSIVWIVGLLMYKYRKVTVEMKKQIRLLGSGICFFLASFFTFGFVSSYLTSVGILANSELEMYGLFGMIVFMVYVGVLIVRFKTFHVGMIAAQALVVALIVVIATQLTFVRSTTNIVLTSIALVFTTIIGIFLVRSVRREVTQRKHIEKLAADLEIANGRLKQLDQLKSEFLSVASHQLRAPMTAIKGYVANILDGSYGEVPVYLKQPLGIVQDSARIMIASIEDYLNISRIEQGRMKYEKSEFDLSDLAHRVVNELEPVAKNKGLKLLFSTEGPIKVTADIGKIKQVITNLADNAIKYTPQGSVTVTVSKSQTSGRITITDTGVGIAPEDIEKLFSKFTRTRDANKVNTTGTGLGLYVAKQLTEGNGGKIWVESDGLGKGSRFIIELPT